MGISLPSLSLRLGMYSSCFGGFPEASGADVDVTEFIFFCLFFFFGG